MLLIVRSLYATTRHEYMMIPHRCQWRGHDAHTSQSTGTRSYSTGRRHGGVARGRTQTRRVRTDRWLVYRSRRPATDSHLQRTHAARHARDCWLTHTSTGLYRLMSWQRIGKTLRWWWRQQRNSSNHAIGQRYVLGTAHKWYCNHIARAVQKVLESHQKVSTDFLHNPWCAAH